MSSRGTMDQIPYVIPFLICYNLYIKQHCVVRYLLEIFKFAIVERSSFILFLILLLIFLLAFIKSSLGSQIIGNCRYSISSSFTWNLASYNSTSFIPSSPPNLIANLAEVVKFHHDFFFNSTMKDCRFMVHLQIKKKHFPVQGYWYNIW